LKDYSIHASRKTTINHAISSAISVADKYDDEKIDNALKLLGEDPEEKLNCIYCSRPVETIDHVMATVKNGKYSGYGVNNKQYIALSIGRTKENASEIIMAFVLSDNQINQRSCYQ
jgi:hypothetical protein